MARHNYFEFMEDFFRQQVYSTTAADNAPFLIHQTKTAGTPTFALNTPSASGELSLACDTTNEAQVVTLYQNDILQFDITKIVEVEFRLKLNQAACNALTSLTFGICQGHNDTIASIGTPSALFKLAGASGTIKVNANDGTNTNGGDQTSTQTLTNVYRLFKINFANLSDVKFYVDNLPICTTTTFNMSAAAAGTGVQLMAQIQKSGSAAADGFTIDYVHCDGRRLAA